MRTLRDGLLAAIAVAAVLLGLLLIASDGQPRRAFGVTQVVYHGR
jgi:hypothetical protein